MLDQLLFAFEREKAHKIRLAPPKTGLVPPDGWNMLRAWLSLQNLGELTFQNSLDISKDSVCN